MIEFLEYLGFVLVTCFLIAFTAIAFMQIGFYKLAGKYYTNLLKKSKKWEKIWKEEIDKFETEYDKIKFLHAVDKLSDILWEDPFED